MSTRDKEIVASFRAALADQIGQSRFDLWFGSVATIDLCDRLVVIGAKDEFTRDLLRSQFSGAVRNAAATVFQAEPPIEFSVEFKVLDLGQIDCGRQPAPDAKSSRSEVLTETERPDRNRSAVSPRPSGRPAKVTFDEFVEGPCNAIAVSSARHAARRPGRCSPLLLFGPTATGKTHLLEAICTDVRRRHTRANVLYLTAEQFTTAFIEALGGRKLPGFRHKFRGVDFLLLDDIHFLAGKAATLVELQHTLDTLLRAGKQVVLAADRPPRKLDVLGQEIVSRLVGGLVCEIEPPNYETRVGIARQLSARIGLPISDDILSSVATHIATNAREIAGGLHRIRATSLALEQPITPSFAEKVLAEMAQQNAPSVGLPEIERAVCDVFGVAPQALKSKRTAAGVAAGRTLAMYLARRHTRAALSEIGHFFGRKSHSTVITAGKRVAGWVSRQKDLQVGDRTCGVEEAIRRVEERLRRA